MKKKFLLNWVYYRPVGHVVEALKLAKGFALANSDIEVYLLLNSASPIELASACDWIKETYPVSLSEIWKDGDKAKTIEDLPKVWDYIITDDRTNRFVSGWDEDDLIKAHTVLTSVLEATVDKGFVEQGKPHESILPCINNPKINLPIPDSAKDFADRYKHLGPAICVMLGGSAGEKQGPSMLMWASICEALFNSIPEIKIYFTGVDKSVGGRTATDDYKLDDIQKLADRLPNAEVAYNIGLWNQLALIQKCDLFLSPHTGFAFLPPLVGTPWLELANCRWPAYMFNYIPFYSVLPECGWYPSTNETKEGCGKLLSEDKKSICTTDAFLEKKIPEIVYGAKLLLDKNFTYSQAVKIHLDKIKEHYDISKFFFFGGMEGLIQKEFYRHDPNSLGDPQT